MKGRIMKTKFLLLMTLLLMGSIGIAESEIDFEDQENETESTELDQEEAESPSDDLFTHILERDKLITPLFTNEHGTPRRAKAAYGGNLAFIRCQKEAPKKWELVKINENMWDASWAAWEKRSLESLRDSYLPKDGYQADNVYKLDQIQSELIQSAHRHRMILKDCTALKSMMNYVDYSNPEHTANEQEIVKKSADGKVICRTSGAETQDFPRCVEMMQAYNAAIVADMGMKAYQEIDFMDDQMDNQLKMMKDPNNPTNSLKMQRDNVKQMAKSSYQRGALNAGKLTVLSSMLGAMPTKAQLVKECERSEKVKNVHLQMDAHFNKVLDKYVRPFFNEASEASEHLASSQQTYQDLTSSKPGQAKKGNETEDEDEAEGTTCQQMAYEGGVNLIANQPARDAAKQIIINSGITMASDLAKGAILNHQAKKIQRAINGIKDFEPVDNGYDQWDQLASLCQVNPGHPDCAALQGTGERGFHNNNINLGGMGNSSMSGQKNDEFDSDSSKGEARDGIDRTGLGVGFGVASGVADKSNAFTSRPGAASVKTGALGGIKPGGGGGGGGGGASAPSGGGAKGQKGRGSGAYRGGKKYSYGGGKGSMKYGSSSRRSKRVKSRAGNPFSGLLGTGKKRAKTLHFRGPASIGSKGVNLFSLIEKRYNAVEKRGELLHYKPIK